MQRAQDPNSDLGFASTGFVIMCSALVFLMTPGVGLLYSGLSRSKDALAMLLLSMISYALVCIQWLLFGFSLSFSETGSPFIGNFKYAGLTGLGLKPLPFTGPMVPGIVYALYELQFAAVTVAIIFGSITGRARLLPAIVFSFVWCTVVYNPISYWTWSARGWLNNLSCLASTSLDQIPCQQGALDFAGGGPVHMASGFAALAYCIMIGQRKGSGSSAHRHNMANMFIGTSLLWFGWFGFNGGSAVSATARAGMAALVTPLSGAGGAIAWTLVDFHRKGKISSVAFCSGAVTGLVAITPGSGYVAPWSAVLIGLLAGIAASQTGNLSFILGFDDPVDSFSIHGVGGLIGSLCVGIFAQKWMGDLDGVEFSGGLINGYPVQLGYQVIACLVVPAYSFAISIFILFIINKIPYLHLRTSDDEEILGADYIEMGETAYQLHTPLNPVTEVFDMTARITR